MSNEIMEMIKSKADGDVRCSDEEFVPFDCFGSNMDDAYFGGLDDGAIEFAQRILSMLALAEDADE